MEKEDIIIDIRNIRGDLVELTEQLEDVAHDLLVLVTVINNSDIET